MKTATITWITYDNYGTVLQALSLQDYIKSIGFENEIISDKAIVTELQNQNRKIQNNPQKITQRVVPQDKSVLVRIKKNVFHPVKTAKKVYSYICDYYYLKKQKKDYEIFNNSIELIREFKRNNLEIRYGLSKKDMSKLDLDYDAFICGSDQIWSLLDKNFEPYFFLDFTSKRKIAYAPSIGAYDIPLSRSNDVVELLNDFKQISVRESDTAKTLEHLLDRKVEWVCDPTLLNDRAYWQNKIKSIRIKKRKYILCYFLSNNSWYFDYVENLAKHLNLKIVLMNNIRDFFGKKYVYRKSIGPMKFVKLFEQSDFVVTDSYHGTLFSMMFEKQFIHLQRFKSDALDNQNIRVESILNYLNLNDLFVEEKVFSKDDLRHIDYSLTNNKIEKFRKLSQEYLKRGLMNEK